MKQSTIGFAKTVFAVCLCVAGLHSTGSAADDLLDLLSKNQGPSEAGSAGQRADGANSSGTPSANFSFGFQVVKLSIPPEQKTLTAEQTILSQLIDDMKWDQSLFQFDSAFPATGAVAVDLGKSEKTHLSNRSALKNYILFRNGLELTGLEGLLTQAKPEQLSPLLAETWREQAPDHHRIWSSVNPGIWTPAWTAVFGIGSEMRLKGRQIYSANDVATLKELIKKTTVDTRERAWLTWQLILAQAQNDDLGAAGKALALLMKMANNPVSSDLMTTTAARMLFQSGFLDAALKYYKMVPKSSDDWFDVQEEMGWAYLRKAEPQNAIAIAKSLSPDHFRAFVGPESSFMAALASLKVCDYGAVYSGLLAFKERYKPRADRMQKVASGEFESLPAARDAVLRYLNRSESRTLKLTELGADADWLPRFVTRDETLLWLNRSAAVHALESKKASDLHARSVSGGSSTVGFQGAIAELSDGVAKKSRAASAAAVGRLKELASEEVEEIKTILSKMHIVEAEMIQQMALLNQTLSKTQPVELQTLNKVGSTGSSGRDQLRFAASKEVWFDEYSNFKVDVRRGCAAVSSKSAVKASAQ